MLGMDQYEMIRTAHRKYGKTIREWAREYGVTVIIKCTKNGQEKCATNEVGVK